MKPEDVQEMPGWVCVARAAQLLGSSKQTVYYRMFTTEQIQNILSVPGATDDSRPFYLLSAREIEKIAADEAAEAAARADHVDRKTLINERNKRIKAWGKATNWQGNIRTAGQPTKALVDAYEAVHPEDVLG